MKRLIFRLILPLSFIFFLLFTKWWLAETEFGQQYLYGFPLPYTSACVSDTECSQYFLLPLVCDWLCYFLPLLMVAWLVRRYRRASIHRAVGVILWLINAVFYIPVIVHKSMHGNTEYYMKREFDIYRVNKSGYIFIWEHDPIIDYNKLQPSKAVEKVSLR
jgi:hypothetical protein